MKEVEVGQVASGGGGRWLIPTRHPPNLYTTFYNYTNALQKQPAVGQVLGSCGAWCKIAPDWCELEWRGDIGYSLGSSNL